MSVALWIVQGLLAAFFGAGGVAKPAQDRKRLRDQGLAAAAASVAWGRFGPYAF